jgi:molybdate transport system substrate-binding protein
MAARLNRLKLAAVLTAAALAVAPTAARAQDVLVFAAASLKNALDAIVHSYRGAGGGGVAIAYAASSALARQIEAGAPADIVFLADGEWLDYLAARRLIAASTRADLLGNRLVLVAPAASRAAVDIAPDFPLAEMLGPGRLAMAASASVPAGKYAKAALEKLGVWDSVRHRLAETENVRAALAFVARGEAPLGIVYASDALAEPKVRIVAGFPAGSHPPIVYPAALTAGTVHPAAAGFLAYLQTPAAKALFARHGFSVL